MRLPDPFHPERDPQAVGEYSGVRLFLQSARRQQPAFALTSANTQAVVGICQAVQGMPLGMELAASWLELLEPVEILSEMYNSLDFLEAQQRDVPERQRSLPRRV